ncbi:hypothetical protein RRG08_019720 [Elysia crispata]|uniref:Uncharacterized protein n=1 Tax=Elysia crispata TaxID=231223 RepID=A0AAE0YME1_9GAST|nr:hypothetical protein RRG08_019720 [Elysia crispata]
MGGMFLRGQGRIVLAYALAISFILVFLQIKIVPSLYTCDGRALLPLLGCKNGCGVIKSPRPPVRPQDSLSVSNFKNDSNLIEFTPPGFECMFPQVDPFDPEILKLAGLDKQPLKCDKDFVPEITYIDGLSIRINHSTVTDQSSQVACKYRNITREQYQDNNILLSEWSEVFTTSIGITEEHEFIFVECHDLQKEEKVVSKAFYSLVPRRAHLEQLYRSLIEKRLREFEPKETLNIIAVALDGLPRHQMIRALPKTYTFLTEGLKSFDFTMHGQSGDNTLPNLLSLLSAHSYADVQKWWNFDTPQDVFELIWRDFERAGYRTLYTEDDPKGGGFYWGGREFKQPQTSYWNRPLELALDDSGFVRRNGFCFGPRSVSEYQLDYLMRFLDTFPSDPVSCMTIITAITHDDISNARIVDEHILNFYKKLIARGHMQNSVVIFFSDHGSRWGKIRETYNGVVESRNPFMLLTFPTWFLKKYPDTRRNLETNTRRLTSHSDTRQMLLDLLYFKSSRPTPPFRGKHGLSLFQEIPTYRTCENASIPENQCLCGQKVEKFLSVSSANVKPLARSLLLALKKKSDRAKCEEYSLGKVLQVGKLSVPKALQNAKRQQMAYSVRLTVEPGGAIFEATVTKDQKTKEVFVGANIERLSKYKGEVECQPTSRQQIFCYCKGNKRKKSDS